MSGCSRHPSKESVGACSNCGKLTCAVCHVEHNGKSYCQPCAEKLFPAGSKPESLLTPLPSQPAAEIKATAPTSNEQSAEVKEPVAATASAPAASKKPIAKEVLPPTTPTAPEKQEISPFWWLAPVIFSIVGGLVAWLMNRQKDARMALYMLFGGIGMTVLQGIVAIILVLVLLAPAAVKSGLKPPTTSNNVPSTASSSNTILSGINGSKPIVVGPAVETPQPPAVKLNPLVTKTLQPSDQDQVVSYQDKLKVTIPGDQLKESQKLVISSVGNPPAPTQSQTRLAVYDISFEKQHEFEKDLTISFAYDPAALPQGADPDLLQVSFLDEENKGWLTVPSGIDSANHMLTVQTAHNGLWQVVYDVKGQVALLTEHFVIYFKPSDFGGPKLDRWFVLDKQSRRVAAHTDNWTTAEYNEWATLASDTDIQNLGGIAGYEGCIPDGYKYYYTANPRVPKFIIDIGYFGERTLKKYEVFGREPLYSSITFMTEFKIAADSERVTPSGKGWKLEYRETLPSPGFTTTYSRLPVYVEVDTVNPCYSGWSRSIKIGSSIADRSLPFFLGHELFHAIQHADYWLASRQALGQPANFLNIKDANLWWFESTADYASWKIANGSTEPTNRNIDPGYLGKNFFCNFNTGDFVESAVSNITLNKVNLDLGNNPNDPCSKQHPYQNAWFWNFLGYNYDADFVDMYTKVRESWGVRSGLEKYVQDNLASGSLFEAYRDFVVEVLFNKDGPYKGDKLTTETLTLPLGESKSYHFLMLPGMSAQYLGALVQGKDYNGGRKLSIRLDNLNVPSSASKNLVYDIYKLRGNERGIPNLEQVETWKPIEEPDKPTKYVIDLAENEALFVVITYDSSTYDIYDCAFFDLILEDEINPTLSIIPPPEVPFGSKGTTCVPYTFEAKPGGMPKDVSYTWYIDGTETVTSTDTTMKHAYSPGVHKIKVVAIWGKGDSEGRKDAQCEFYIGNPKLTIEGPAELKPGEKGTMGDSYTFTVKPEYVPDSADYTWDSGATGTQCSFTQLGPGLATVKATANWDVNGCKGKVDGSTTFEFANQSIDIVASPPVGIEGGTTTFTAFGEHIPKTGMFSWEIDDTTGVSGVTCLKIETQVSHKYDTAGTYAVKVTVVDKQGYTGASKQIKYTVNAAAPVAPASLDIQLPPPAPSQPLDPAVLNIFRALPHNILPGALYQWYIDGRGVMSGRDETQADAPPGFFADGSHTIRVVASWTDAKGITQSKDASASFSVKTKATPSNQVPKTSTSGCTLKIQPTSVNGEPGTYTFTASQTSLSNPTFIWDIDGSPIQNSASNKFSHDFKWVGTGKVTVTLVDGGKQLCAATAPVTIHKAAQTPTPVAPTPAPTGTGWYLDGAPVIDKANLSPDDDCRSGRKLTISDGSASGSMSWKDCNYHTKCNGTYTGSVTWTPPPSFMEPGSKIKFTMSEKSTEQDYYCDRQNFSSSGWIKVDGAFIVEVMDYTHTPTATAFYTVRTGSPGAKMVVYVGVGMESGHGSVTYNYTYR